MVDGTDDIPQGDKAVWCRIFEKSPELSALVIDHAGPVAVIDSKLNVVYRNKGLDDLFLSQQLPVSRQLSLGCETCEAALTNALQDALTGKRVELPALCAKSPAGQIAHLEARLIGLKSRTGSRFVVAFITDKTSHVNLAERLASLEDFAQIGLVMPYVGHQMNNSLATVIGFSKLLASGAMAESSRGDAQAIHEASLRCRQLTDKFFRFASEQCRPAEMEVNHWIANMLRPVAPELERHGIHCRLELDPSQPRTKVSVPFVEQAFINVINRARQAMPAGGTLVVRSRRAVAARNPDNALAMPEAPSSVVEIAIGDTAGEIPASDVAGLFEPFTVSPSKTRQIGLIGFARMLLKHQRGDLLLERTSSEGSTFVIQLPILQELAPAEQPAAQAQARSKKIAKAILVVDDDDMCRMMLAEALARDGHFVDTAGDGQAALAKIAGSSYDVIVADVRMPGMDGPALYAEIGKRYPQLVSRILFITGDSTNGSTQEFLTGLANPFLVKPFAIEELLVAVKNM